MIDAARLAATDHRRLFVATILTGSFLLFLVQPMVARMALPGLGGAPNVWNSAMLVYQALLLAGYAYAHRLGRLSPARQAKVHLALFAVAALTLPIALIDLPAPAPGWEVLWVPLLLGLSVGPVFFLIAAQAPLMQRWYAAQPGAREPWALYAASNLGSFAGLVAYPLIAEPLLPVRGQSIAWSIGYGALVMLVAAVAWQRRAENAAPIAEGHVDAVPSEPIGWRRIALWLLLSAIPSGLMLSTATHLTTDIFAMPLLWVIPLGLYLLSFVAAFSDNRVVSWAITVFAPITLLLAGGLAMVSRSGGTLWPALASVVLLFVVAVALHSRLYDERPEPARLTLYYLVMSLGGALGGAFTAVLAPVLFDWVWEHPLLVLAAAAVVPLSSLYDWRQGPGLDPWIERTAIVLLLALAAVCAYFLTENTAKAEPGFMRIWLTAGITLAGVLLIPWRLAYVCVVLLTMLGQGGLETVNQTVEGLRTRSYFGIYTVRDYPETAVRTLAHGTTLHGQQYTDARSRLPSTYYGPDSGVGLALVAAPQLYGSDARIGVVGLGTGTLACYRKPGQRWTFYEIDPAVVALSRDRTFTYLADCTPDARIALGDARLALASARPGSLDVLAIDAFSSDAIPLHLLTQEAIGVYMRALSQDGLLLVHISNRFIELEPVIAAAARAQGLVARSREDNPAERSVFTPSVWVAISRTPEGLARLERIRADAPWIGLGAPADSAWTDDHASILPYIRWNRLLRTP